MVACVAAGLALANALADAAAVAENPREPAAVFPARTLAYVGWNGVVQRGDSLVPLVSQWLEAAAADAQRDARIAAIRDLWSAVTLALEHGGGLGVLDARIADGEPVFDVGAVVFAEEEREELARLISSAVERFAGGTANGAARIADVSFRTLRLGDSPLILHWGECDGCLVISIGEPAARELVGRLRKKDGADCLAEARRFMLGRERTSALAAAWTLDVSIDLEGCLASTLRVLDGLGVAAPATKRILEALGVADLRTVYVHAGPGERGTCVRTFVEMAAQRRGIAAWFKQAPLSEADLRIVPQDACWAQVWNLDLPSLWKHASQAIEAIDPNAGTPMQSALAAARVLLGFSPVDDLLPALGDTWTLYDAPNHGGMLMSGTVLAIEAADPQAVRGMLAQVNSLLPQWIHARLPDVRPVVRTAQCGSHQVTYLLLGGTWAPMAPAWGLAGDRLVIGLSPQAVAEALKQADPATRGPCLLDNPDFRAARQGLPRESISLGYTDTRALMRSLYPVALLYATTVSSATASSAVSADLSILPTLTHALEQAGCTVSVGAMVDDGVLYSQIGCGPTLVEVAAAGALLSGVVLPAIEMAQ